MGDADLSAEAMLINYDCGAFFQMFMKNMDSEIDPDGSLTDVVPFVRYGGRPGDPSWTAAFIEVAYQLWKQEGNVAIPKMYWDKIRLHLSKFAEMAKADASKWPPTKYGKCTWWQTKVVSLRHRLRAGIFAEITIMCRHHYCC